MKLYLALLRGLSSCSKPAVWQRVVFYLAAVWLAWDVWALCSWNSCIIPTNFLWWNVTLWPGGMITSWLSFQRPMELWEAITYVIVLYVPSLVCVGILCHILRRAIDVIVGLAPDAVEPER
ncbi:MAG: hypothetical protein AAF517_05890 [Planctomycetota bacterium]